MKYPLIGVINIESMFQCFHNYLTRLRTHKAAVNDIKSLKHSQSNELGISLQYICNMDTPSYLIAYISQLLGINRSDVSLSS
jgi:hypothetical protein